MPTGTFFLFNFRFFSFFFQIFSNFLISPPPPPKKKSAAIRVAMIWATRYTGNKPCFKGGLSIKFYLPDCITSQIKILPRFYIPVINIIISEFVLHLPITKLYLSRAGGQCFMLSPVHVEPIFHEM